MKRILLSFLVALPILLNAQIIYVDQSATGANDGTSWTDAYTELMPAFQDATSTYIVVAKGTYTPHASDQNVAFYISEQIHLYGGFAGGEVINSTSIANRDLILNETILSGDLNGDDQTTGNKTDNSYYVIRGMKNYASDPSKCVIDGITISGGNANNNPTQYMDDGGAIRNIAATGDTIGYTLRNVTITENSGSSAIYNYSTGGAIRIVLENCLMYRNGATSLIYNNIYGNDSLENTTHLINCNIVNSGYIFKHSYLGISSKATWGLKVSNCILWSEKWPVIYETPMSSLYVKFDHCLLPSAFTSQMADSGNNITMKDPMFVDTTYNYSESFTHIPNHPYNDSLYSISPAIGNADPSYGFGNNIGHFQGVPKYTPLIMNDLSDISYIGCADAEFDAIPVTFIAEDVNDVTIAVTSSDQSVIRDSNITVSGSEGSWLINVQHDTLLALGTVTIKVNLSNTAMDKDSTEFTLTFAQPQISSLVITPQVPPLNTGAVELEAINGTPPYSYCMENIYGPWAGDDVVQASSLFEYLGNNSYTFYIKDSIGCTTKDTTAYVRTIYEIDPNNIILNNNSVNVYPNPTTNFIHIEGLISNDNICIYNIVGEKLLSSSSDLNNSFIDVSELPTGVYTLSVIREGVTISKLFIKE